MKRLNSLSLAPREWPLRKITLELICISGVLKYWLMVTERRESTLRTAVSWVGKEVRLELAIIQGKPKEVIEAATNLGLDEESIMLACAAAHKWAGARLLVQGRNEEAKRELDAAENIIANFTIR